MTRHKQSSNFSEQRKGKEELYPCYKIVLDPGKLYLGTVPTFPWTITSYRFLLGSSTESITPLTKPKDNRFLPLDCLQQELLPQSAEPQVCRTQHRDE